MFQEIWQASEKSDAKQCMKCTARTGVIDKFTGFDSMIIFKGAYRINVNIIVVMYDRFHKTCVNIKYFAP